MKIVETLKKREEKKATMQTINHNELKVHFSNVKKPSYLIQNTSFSGSSHKVLSSKKHSNSKLFNASDLAFTNNVKSNIRMGSSRNSSTLLTSELLEVSLKHRKSSQSPQKPRRVTSLHQLNDFIKEREDKPIELNENQLKQAIIWDNSLEEKFKREKDKGKRLFFDEVKRSNWDFLAIRNLAQELFTEEKKTAQRKEKMKIYGEGGFLTAEELKFIADSSELLNACVDRRYLQNAVNIINGTNLHYIELNLAEKIIRKHEKIKNIVKEARLNYFQQKNQETIMKIQGFNTREKKGKRQAALSEQGSRYKKMIGTIWEIIEVKNSEKQLKEDEDIIAEMILKNFSAKFKKTFSIADLIRKKEAKNTKEIIENKQIKKPQYQNLINEFNNPLVVKHRYHPASKLHKLDIEEKTLKGRKYLNNLENQEQVFKISIKCPNTIRVPNNFIKFYSGGPNNKSISPLYVRNLYNLRILSV